MSIWVTGERYRKSGTTPIFWRVNDSGKEPFLSIYTKGGEYLGGGIKNREGESFEQYKNYEELAKKAQLNAVGCVLEEGRICIDIDSKFYEGDKDLLAEIMDVIKAIEPEKAKDVFVERSRSGGHHIVYKVLDKQKSGKIARHSGKTKEGRKKEAFLEIRGQESYLVTAPTQGYEILQSEWTNVPEFSQKSHEAIMGLLKAMDEEHQEEKKEKPQKYSNTTYQTGLSTFDDFAQRGDVTYLLEDLGWTHTGGKFWRRGGKDRGVSGTLGFIGHNVFYSFTSNGGVDSGCYTAAQLFAAVKHGGDLSSAARDLYQQGYGDRFKRSESVKSVSDRIKESIETPLKEVEIEGRVFYDTPTIPDSLYEKLPKELTAIALDQDTKRERDLTFLDTLILVCSVCEKVRVVHDKSALFCNMMLFASTRAAGGKGKAGKAISALDDIIEHQEKEHLQQMMEYNALKDAEKSVKHPPIKKKHLLPNDNTGASIVMTMANNDGGGYMFLSEAKGIANKVATEHGRDIKTTFLQSFHNERIINHRVGRKGREEIDIKHPRLSCTLTGVLSDLPRMFPSVEDGLFSRFMFYVFNEETVPRNPYESGLASTYDKEVTELRKLCNDIYFNLPSKIVCGTMDQGKIMKEWMEQEQAKGHVEETAQWLRVNCMVSKIQGILTAIRAVNTGEYVDEFHDDDFSVAMELCHVLLKHSYAVKSFIDDSKGLKKDKEGNIDIDIDSLPAEDLLLLSMKEGEEWDRKKREKYGETIGVKEQMVRRYLGRLLNKEKVELKLKGKSKIFVKL